MSNTVCIDWLQATLKNPSDDEPFNVFLQHIVNDILLLDYEKFAFESWGKNTYNSHIAFGEIKIYYSTGLRNGKRRSDVSLEMGGQACRQYEHYLDGNYRNWVSLIQILLENQAKFTRLDIANDIYDDLLDVQKIHDYCRQGLCITKARYYEYHETGLNSSGEIVGETVNIGKKGNDSQQLGIYNKRMEQKEKGKLVPGVSSWVRCELRLFGQRAHGLAKILSTARPLREVFFEILSSSYRFVMADRNTTDDNKWRRPTVEWWKNYIGSSATTILKVEREKSTIERQIKYLEKQVPKTLAKVYKAQELAYGKDKAINFLLSLLEKGEHALEEKDFNDIEQYAVEQNSSVYWGTRPIKE